MSDEKIKIGTLVNAGGKNQPANYIRQIAPHGFESYSITFWQTLGNTNLTKLAKEVNAAVEESGAVIGSIGVFGNPLGDRPIDKETRDGWKKLRYGWRLEPWRLEHRTQPDRVGNDV